MPQLLTEYKKLGRPAYLPSAGPTCGASIFVAFAHETVAYWSTVFAFGAVQIITSIGMSLWAMGFASVTCAIAFSSQIVGSHRDGLQMFWINAPHVATHMVNRKRLWYRPDHILVDPTSRTAGFSVLGRELCVTIFVAPGRPVMTALGSVDNNLFTKTIDRVCRGLPRRPLVITPL